MGDPAILLRETPHHIIKDATSTGITSATTATVTVAAKRRRVQRIVKKHLQQKYLLSGFAIHVINMLLFMSVLCIVSIVFLSAFLASPAYLYGIVVDYDISFIIRIWPPIIYVAVGQICQSFLLHLAERQQNHIHSNWKNRKTYICATLITCSSIIVCGFLFSSAWIIMTPTTQMIAVVSYGIFGGIGSGLIYARTHTILEQVRPKEDKYVRKTIHLCGEAFCQLFLSFVFTSLRTLYGISQTLVLMAALLINLIPLGLLVTRQQRNNVNLNNVHSKFSLTRTQETTLHGLQNRLKPTTPSAMDQLDGIELQQTTWRNPQNSVEMHYNKYMALAVEDPYTTYINPNGVEIMEIIPEEDENISTIRSSSITIDRQSRISSNTNEQHHENGLQLDRDYTNFEKIHEFSKNLTNQMFDSMTDNIVVPLQRAMTIVKLYPATILQSSDIFSYVMCLIVLPGLAVRHHALKFAEIPFLFSLLAFPWMCFALMTPRFGQSLVREKNKWHALGCILKGIALYFIGISESKLLLSLAAVLLGFGQAVTMFLQDMIIQDGVPKAQWIDVKYPLYAINGALILVWGTCAHLTIKSFNFQASVTFSSILYFVSIVIWYAFSEKCFIKNKRRKICFKT